MALKWNHPPLAFAWCSLLSYILYTYFSVGSNRHPMFDGWLAGWLAVAGLRASFWRFPVSLCVYCCVDGAASEPTAHTCNGSDFLQSADAQFLTHTQKLDSFR